MQPWFETIGVLILAFLAITLGLLIGKVKKSIWLLGYSIPLMLIILVALVRNKTGSDFTSLFLSSAPAEGNSSYSLLPYLWFLAL